MRDKGGQISRLTSTNERTWKSPCRRFKSVSGHHRALRGAVPVGAAFLHL